MRTTMDIDDHLLIEAKRIAVERRSSLKAVVEDGLRAIVGARLREGYRADGVWPICTTAKPVPGVDLTSSSALLDLTGPEA